MKRRDFIAASGAMVTLPLQAMARPSETRQADDQQYFELIIYQTHVGARRNRVADFYRDVALPAYGRLGLGPVGVFTVLYGPNQPSLYVLVPHPSLASIVTMPARLLDDTDYRQHGADFLNAPLGDPAYVRIERRLMVAFAGMPRLEAPTALLERSRIFELRTYESHSLKAAQKKIAMFNEGGEIDIFRKTGLQPVFFGETLFGPALPNLTYMLVFENMARRDASWDRFRTDPDWLTLREVPLYQNTVSNITDIILRPTSFSQV